MPKPAGTSPPAKLISGTRQLGAALGVSHVAASKYLEHDEWPFGNGPWPADRVPLMQQWQADTLRPANEGGEDVDLLAPGGKKKDTPTATYKKLQCLYVQQKIEGEKIANAQKRKELVNRADIEAQFCAKLERLKRRMLAMANRLPFDDQIKDVVRRHVREDFEAEAGPAPT